MNNEQLLKKLKGFDACGDAVEWVNGMDFKTAWEKCERADWMLWFICRMEIATQKERIHIICDCAETSLQYVPKGEDRPRQAILAARKYADNPTKENREDAAAYSVGAAAAAVYAVAYAADDDAAVYDEAAVYAAAAAAYAADDAAVYAAAYAADAAKKKAHIKMCNMIRRKIKLQV